MCWGMRSCVGHAARRSRARGRRRRGRRARAAARAGRRGRAAPSRGRRRTPQARASRRRSASRSFGASGPNGMKIVPVEGRGQRRGRVHLARDPDRLVDQAARLSEGVDPVELLRLGAQKRRAGRGPLGADRLERLVDQAEQALVDLPGGAHHRDADRRADQAVGVAQGARRLGGPAEGAAGVGDAAPRSPRPRPAASSRLVRRASSGCVGQLEHLERALVDLGRLLVGELVHRLRAGALGVVDRLGRVAARRRGEEVVCELAEAVIGIVAAQLLQRQRRSARADARALRRAELVVEGVADQRVREREAPASRLR